jgi:hypothetical protein
MNDNPRDIAGAYGSLDHLARLLAHDLWDWKYFAKRWFRYDCGKWVEALPPREMCREKIENVIAAAEIILRELREEDREKLIDQMLVRVLADPQLDQRPV